MTIQTQKFDSNIRQIGGNASKLNVVLKIYIMFSSKFKFATREQLFWSCIRIGNA